MPYQIDARIQVHAPDSEGIHRLRLEGPAIAEHARPGQFVQILYDGPFGPLMPRPFSIHDVDRDSGCFDILYAARGHFTSGMTALDSGITVSVVGPLGNTFSLLPGPIETHVLVAGGVGAPPLHFLAKETLQSARGTPLLVINGARSREHLVAVHDFEALGANLRVTTDDGSAGRHGTVLAELGDVTESGSRVAVYACGPEPMLRAVALHCIERRVPCRVSLETVMPCGTGVCMGCVVKVRSSQEPDGYTYARACHDGPVFDAEELIWD